MHDKIMFMCKQGNAVVFTHAFDREDAKKRARSWLAGDPETYIVTPLTNPGDRIHLALTMYA